MALVLVVDDSPTDQHVISGLLEKNGHETLVASDGEEAIKVAMASRPDVILMDVVMQGMDGYKATRELTRNPDTSSIPVVMISSKDQETDRIWGLRQGAAAYLTKPVANQQLVEVIKSVLVK